MVIEVKVPSPGESITEVQLAEWLIENGSYVEKDTEIAEIDSDKATLSISAEDSGTISFKVEAGSTVEIGTVIATIDTGAESGKKPATEKQKEIPAATDEKVVEKEPAKTQKKEPVPAKISDAIQVKDSQAHMQISPLARKLMEEKNLDETALLNILRHYRIGKQDIEYFSDLPLAGKDTPGQDTVEWGGTRNTESKKMSTLRLKIAERLVAVKNETAMLTTFNEVNMTPIMDIRKKYKDIFKEKHGISLGFMSFFTKAITEALSLFPQANAQINENELIFHDYADIGIAVSTPKGLMVPVIRNAETLTMAEIELKIKELATRARDNKITLDELKGGTFTITNGGVFGSMLSTPILNPPQSAILGMHNIVERPIAVNGQVEIHPMMYIALSYDHRIIDGKESVSFLVKVKEMLEEPAKMMFRGGDPAKSLLGI